MTNPINKFKSLAGSGLLRCAALTLVAGIYGTAAASQGANPQSASAAVSAETRAAVVSALARLAPRAPAPESIQQSPVPGLLEVRSGSQVVYVTPDGKLLIEGQMVDTMTRTNLTQESVNRALAVDFASLPLKDALITHKSGTGERRIAVFADPHCGFCKRYEPELVKLQNATVYTFMIPVLGSRSEEMVKRIACSADPAKAWDDWMLRNAEPAPAAESCATPAWSAVARNRDLARKLGINSTPTSLTAPKKRHPGYMQAPQIEVFLGSVAAPAQTSAKP